MSDTDLTPLMRQYREIKRAYQDAILFFRVGDFYEMFYDDAEEASQLLSIALTTRDKTSASPVPLCGVPVHAATGYIAKLLKAGRTVALCEQVEDPKLAKGLVRREVVRLYTPGTLTDSELLPAREANFLAAVTVSASEPEKQLLGLATLELSTGEFWVTEYKGVRAVKELEDELARLEPRELIHPSTLSEHVGHAFAQAGPARLCPRDPSTFDLRRAHQLLLEQFGVASLDGFGLKGFTVGVQAAGALLHYVRETRPTANLAHLQGLRVRRSDDTMCLDSATIRNLELVRSLSGDRNDATLLAVLDRTVTAMGGRLLRDWILRPLLRIEAIEGRLDAVEELVRSLETRMAIRTGLRAIQDIPRLTTRISLRTASPRDLLALKQSVAVLPDLRARLATCQASLLRDLVTRWDNLADVHELIEKTILPNAPASTRDGGIIRDGYDATLDELRAIGRDGKQWIAHLEARERQRTGIDSLKIRFNQVFGYYIEVTKPHLAKVPADYSRKQTLVHAERFVTPALKALEEKVIGAEARQKALEQELFERILAQIAQATGRLQAMGALLATLDVLAALAETAALNGYVRPEVHEGGAILITDGRHPVLEQLGLPHGFIPNDTTLDLDANRLLILTGPNMGGKSTYLRQVALIVLMAQMGSYVPARSARIGLVDRIFTRIGAADNLAGGQSTFMVEMIETAQILNSATARSLILLDEIGRGTSTYDGLSLAWAVAEYLLDHRSVGARTLFATHYHELTALAQTYPGVKNYTVAVREQNDEVLFLHKIVEGSADRSYGIHVARLAGLPGPVIKRAKDLLAHLERSSTLAQALAGGISSFKARGGFRSCTPLLARPQSGLEEGRQIDLFEWNRPEASSE